MAPQVKPAAGVAIAEKGTHFPFKKTELASRFFWLLTLTFKLQIESIWIIKYYFVIYLGHQNITLSFPYRPSLRYYSKVPARFLSTYPNNNSQLLR